MPLVAYENEAFAIGEPDLTYLRNLLGGFLDRRDDGWAICRVVGHVALPSGDTLFVRSRKAPAAAIFAWFAYVDPKLQALRFLGVIPKTAEEGELSSIVARAFIATLLDAFYRHGLNRHYHRVRIQTGTVRGAIDFPRLVRLGGELSRLPCIAWERLPRTPLNQTLAAALDCIVRDRVMRHACRHDLPAAVSAFADVPPKADGAVLAGRTPLARNERHLEPLLSLARLILTCTGLAEGQAELGAAFLVNLETLFERTVAHVFEEAGIGAETKVPVPYEIHSPTGKKSGGAMEMDVFVPRSAGGPLVIDAKYKTTVASANLQQMVTYCFATGARKAVLVLPKGFVRGGDHYRVVSGSSDERRSDRVDILVAELSTAQPTVAGWKLAGRQLVNGVMGWHARSEARRSGVDATGTVQGSFDPSAAGRA